MLEAQKFAVDHGAELSPENIKKMVQYVEDLFKSMLSENNGKNHKMVAEKMDEYIRKEIIK